MADSPTRIAFLITELDAGGAERALVRIVTGLDRSRWEPRVLCLSPGGELTRLLEAAAVPVHPLGARSRWDWSVVGKLVMELRAIQPDVLQTFLFHANLTGRMAAWKAGVKCVVSGVRVVEADSRWRMRLDVWTHRLITHCVCVSESVAARYRSLDFPPDKVSVIPNGVDSERFEQARPAELANIGIPEGARVLLSVGRLHRQKGTDVLLDAASQCLPDHSDLHLLIVGDGPERQTLEQRIVRSPDRERIHLIGQRSDVPELMRACTLFVLPSRWEGMPNVVLEAMAAGVPVVATDVEGVRELIEDGRTGRIVAPESPEALGGAVSQLLNRPDEALTMAAEARNRVRGHFTWERTVEQYTALWAQLLKAGC